MRSRKIAICGLLALTLSLPSLAACETLEPGDSTTPMVEIDVSNTQGVTLEQSRYGTLTASAQRAEVGEQITLAATCTYSGVELYGIEVNGEVYTDLDDGSISVEMTSDGILAQALYNRELCEFETYVTPTTISVNGLTGAEYSLDGETWQDSSVFSGLTQDTAYTLSVRMKADSDLVASPIEERTLYTAVSNQFAIGILSQLMGTELYLEGDHRIARYVSGVYYDETIYDVDFYYTQEQYSLRTSWADDGEVRVSRDIFCDQQGYACSGNLNIWNEIELTRLGLDRYQDIYYNPFTLLSGSSIYVDSDGSIHANISSSDDQEYFLDMLVGMTDPSIEDIALKLDSSGGLESITIYALTPVADAGLGYTVQYYEEIELHLADADSVYHMQELTPTADTEALQYYLDLLQQGNYTVDYKQTLPSYWSSTVTTATFQADSDICVITPSSGYPYGYAETEDGLTRFQVRGSGEEISLTGVSGYPQSSVSISTKLPQFDILGVFFESNGTNSWTLTSQYNAYQYAARLLPDKMMDDNNIGNIQSGSLDFTINDDGTLTIEYGYTYQYYYTATVEMTVSEIGTTDLGLDFDSQYSPFTGYHTWWDYSEELYDTLRSYLSLDDDEEPEDYVPFYWDETYGIDSFGTTVTGIFTINYYMPADYGNTYFYSNYGEILEQNGFTDNGNGYYYRSSDGYSIRLTGSGLSGYWTTYQIRPSSR